MQAFEVVGKRDVIGNLYITDLLRNDPLLTITYKIILRSLRFMHTGATSPLFLKLGVT
jgi:hypothetical protein